VGVPRSQPWRRCGRIRRRRPCRRCTHRSFLELFVAKGASVWTRRRATEVLRFRYASAQPRYTEVSQVGSRKRVWISGSGVPAVPTGLFGEEEWDPSASAGPGGSKRGRPTKQHGIPLEVPGSKSRSPATQLSDVQLRGCRCLPQEQPERRSSGSATTVRQAAAGEARKRVAEPTRGCAPTSYALIQAYR
jgi:hypothetical protein